MNLIPRLLLSPPETTLELLEPTLRYPLSLHSKTFHDECLIRFKYVKLPKDSEYFPKETKREVSSSTGSRTGNTPANVFRNF
jgi:hypothetical protein